MKRKIEICRNCRFLTVKTQKIDCCSVEKCYGCSLGLEGMCFSRSMFENRIVSNKCPFTLEYVVTTCARAVV